MSARAPERMDPVPTGTIAEIFDQFDWAITPLGDRAFWPPVLQTTVAIMFGSPLPMLVLWGQDGLLLYNDGGAAIAGARHPAMLGTKALESWPETASLHQRVLATCLAGQALSLSAEQLILRRNGGPEAHWLDIDYSPIPGPDGAILGVLAIARDVSARVRAERQRFETESQLALAIEAADLGTWDYDIANDRKYQSARTKQMFGLPPEDAVTQRDFYSGLHQEDRPRIAAAFARAIDPQIRAPYDVEYRVIGAEDGLVRWIASKGRAFFDQAGNPLRIAGTALEITGRKNAERHQACLAELSERLRVLETTAEIAGNAAEILGRTLEGSRAGYAVVDGDYTFIESDWTNGEAVSLVGPRLFADLGDAFAGPLRAGQTLVIPDVTTHPATAAQAQKFAAIHVQALLNAPLLENGQITALLYVHSDRPRQWTPGEIELLQDVAGRTWEAAARARAAQKLRRLNETLEQEVALRTAQRDRMWRLSSDVMLVVDLQGRIESANPAWGALLGWSEDEVIGRDVVELSHIEDRETTRAAVLRCTSVQPATTKYEGRLRKRDGGHVWFSWRAVADDRAIHAVGRDITAEREQAAALQAAEAALRQAQKMEAVGQLTGGIAHDFNNLLQGITGSLDLVEKRLADSRASEAQRFVASARAAANRAVSLTHRLLAFARRQPLDPKPVEANPLIDSMRELLRQSLGERIGLVLNFAPDLWLTRCDPHQLESAILNLAINARDAMPDGGTLTIATENTVFSAGMPELAPGAYISVRVSDTGTGMPESVLEQAFEPFYTTKPIGQGTGLGLSMIYGFARQSGGHVSIRSELGQGTEVTLVLPRFTGAAAAASSPAEYAATPAARHASVLVVEDEAIVRGLVLEALRDIGLDVLEAASGPQGLEILQSSRALDLLVTDIGLPGLNGRQMADAARLGRPGLKILFMTGYAETAASANGFLEPGMAMITKPFAIDDFVARIRAMLEEPEP